MRVRLWGVHAKGARALPGCPKCHDILAVALTIRIPSQRMAAGTSATPEERWLKVVRARFRDLGIPER